MGITDDYEQELIILQEEKSQEIEEVQQEIDKNSAEIDELEDTKIHLQERLANSPPKEIRDNLSDWLEKVIEGQNNLLTKDENLNEKKEGLSSEYDKIQEEIETLKGEGLPPSSSSKSNLNQDSSSQRVKTRNAAKNENDLLPVNSERNVLIQGDANVSTLDEVKKTSVFEPSTVLGLLAFGMSGVIWSHKRKQ